MKHKKVVEKDNIVVFPGLIEKWILEAHQATEQYRFSEANVLFEQILQYSEGDEYLLSVFAHSLYETKSFARSKEICEDILALGPEHYFEVMELYLTICMQLKQFRQVEKIIQTLFDESVIPPQQIEKFQRIQSLNIEIEQNKQMLEDQVNQDQIEDKHEFTAKQFMEKSDAEQLLQVQELSSLNIRPFTNEFKEIIEDEKVHPFIKSLILILLVEQEVSVTVVIQKLGHSVELNPVDLQLPTKLPQFIEIEKIIVATYEKDPSTLELIHHLITKHAIVTYPFEWQPYDTEDVAYTYIHYMQAMFGKIQEHDYEIMDYIQALEKLSELQPI